MAHKMVCGSSYNYNMPSFMGGTGFMPSFVSGMGYSGCSSIFTQMFGGAMCGCNPFVTSYAQPNFNAMAGWAVADSLLNMGTMLVCAGIQGRKDNSVENTYEDIELLKEKKAEKEAEQKDVKSQLSELSDKSSDLQTNVANASTYLERAKDNLNNFCTSNSSALANSEADNYNDLHEKKKELEKAVEDREKEYEAAQKKLEVHEAKVAELNDKKDKLQTEIDTLNAQIKIADEKADEQVLAKLLKRKNCSKYSEVGKKFDENNSLKDSTVSTADAWAVVNAYKNALVDDDDRKKYATQFKAIYDALSPEEQGDFHSIYRLMRDNHPEEFKQTTSS